MNRQAPTVRGPTSQRDDSVQSHPAFAQISVHRVQGQATLYASDFSHQHYMTVLICRSELHRGLSNDHHFSGEELIEVALSESQWATFVSSAGVGGGTPCTLERFDRVSVPGIERTTDRRAQFKGELRERLGKAQRELAALKAEVQTGTRAKGRLMDHIHQIEMNLDGNVGFVADQFDEHIERTVEAAKAEILAFTGRAQRAAVLTLEGESDNG